MGKTLGYGEITVANMIEPFTVMLTNEAQQFATDSNRKVTSAQSYYTDIIVIRGSQERTDYTIGNITSGSGITVSKTSKRVTFSVSAGSVIGADTGVIEIPITLDGQTVKKQFSWSCGKQGPQGAKGNPGTSITITSKSVTYQASSSGTVTPTGTWSTSVPTVNNGQYLWTKTTVQYSDGNKTEAYSVSYKGTNGTNGTSVTVSKTEVTYQVSTSGTTAPTGTWSTAMPTCDQGQYLWTKIYVKYSDGKDTTSYAVSYKGVDGEKFAFNMLRGTNQGSKHWETHYDSNVDGKYSVESFVDEDGTNGVKFICTEKTSRWQYVCFIDYEMIKTLKSATKYVFSCDIKTNVKNGYIKTSLCTGSASNHFADNLATKLKGDNTWEHVVWSFTTYDPLPQVNNQIVYLSSTAVANVGETYIKNLKLTEGTVDTPWAPHPEDLEGRGVAETVQYYLATSQASGVTSSTSGWSTDITTQKLTADKKYLWNCYQTKYSDGTSEPVSTPKVIGVYGDKGVDGQDGEDGAGFHWNLLKYSGDLAQMNYGKVGGYADTQEFITDASTPSKNVLKSTITTVGSGIYIQGKYLKEGFIKKGNTYTVSAWCKCSSAKDVGVMNVEFLDNKVNISMPKLSTEWQQYVITGVANKDVTATSASSAISFYYGNAMNVGDVFYISSPKVEQSDKASPWCTTYEETLAKNLSITPSSQYFKSTDGGKTFAPNAITIKPTLQGEISFGKWQYSIDGGVSFADVVNGQKGLTISNNVLTVSKNSSLYSDAVTMVTFRAVANDSSFYDTCSIAKIYDVSDIGDGRNLWITRDNITLQACEKDKYIYTTTGTSSVCIGATGSSVGTNTIALQTGTKYTISFVISSPSDVGDAMWYFCTALNSTGVKNYGGYGVKLATGENIVSQTITVDTSCDAAGLVLYNLPTGCVIKDIQVEKGSSPTGWTPAPEDVQTAILSTKSEISSVSSKVDQNTKSIENRVEKTTYQNDLKLVKGDINKANEGLNKWRYEIYPKSLFASEYQGKSTMDVFAKNTNLTPSQSVLINDTDFGKSWAYGDNYIGYALTFVKFSAAKSVAITFKHDDGAHLYLNGKLIGGSDGCNTGSGHNLSLSFVKGWNCLEVVLNEITGGEYIGFGTTISAISECQLMNCYYGTPVARQSHITNQLVKNTIDIDGVSTRVGKVTSVIGEDGKNFTDFKNDYSSFKQTMTGFKTTVSSTYVTKSDFDDLEVGGRNLLLYSKDPKNHGDYYNSLGYISLESETFSDCPVWSTKSQWGRLGWNFYNHVILRNVAKVGDTFTYSLYAKTNNSDGKTAGCSYRFQGNSSAGWFNGDTLIPITTSWTRISATFTVTEAMLDETAYLNQIGLEVTSSMSGDDKVYFTSPKLERGTKATDYSVAPEDVETDATTKANNALNSAKSYTDSMEIGGRNLLLGSYKYTKNTPLEVSSSAKDGIKYCYDLKTSIELEAGQQYVLQAQTDGKWATKHEISGKDPSNKLVGLWLIGENTNNFFDMSKGYTIFTPTVTATYTIRVNQYSDGETSYTVHLWDFKVEKGNKPTGWTPAPEDVSGQITTVQSDYKQLADRFSWIVKSGTSASNMTLTDRMLDVIAQNINLTGKVTFSSFDKSAQDKINGIDQKAGNASTAASTAQASANNAKAAADKAQSTADSANTVAKNAQSSVDNLEIGGRNLILGTSNGDSAHWYVYGWSNINNLSSSTKADHCYLLKNGNGWCNMVYDCASHIGETVTFQADVLLDPEHNISDDAGLFYMFDKRPFGTNKGDRYILKSCKIMAANTWVHMEHTFTIDKDNPFIGFYFRGCTSDTSTNSCWIYIKDVKLEKGSKATDYTPAPEDVSQDATTKANQALTDAKEYAKNSVDWVTNNGQKTQNLYSMVSKWAADAISDTTEINGGLIKSNTILARHIAADSITSDKILAGSVTADKINVSDLFAKNITASGTIQSNNYAESNGAATAGSKWILSDGSFKSKNLSWDASGNITAAGGKIGKYTITDSYLITGSGATASGFGGNQAFWAGSSSSNDAPFRVGYNGQLVASGATLTNAIVSGDITAIKGQIGELVLQDGTLTGSGQIIKNKTDSSGNITSTTTTDYITKISQKGLDIESTIMSSDSDTTSNRGICVSPESIHLTYDRLVSRVTPQGLNILGSDSGQVAINNLASTFYYSDEGYRTRLGIDHQGILLMCEDGNKTFKINVSGADGMDISGANVRLQNNITASRFVFYKDSFNYIESLEANNTNNIYFHSNGYYSFRVNNEGNWSNETQSVYITERGISVPGEIGLYSQEMSNYVARYYVAGSTKCTAIGNGSYNTRIYGSSVWTQKAVSTSDVRLKQDFQPLDKFEDLYMNLQPVSFKYIDGYDKSEDRYFGLKAQPTEKLFEDMGENPDDYAMFNKFGIDHEDIKERLGHDVDFDEEHGLDYTNMIALNTHMVQKTRREAAIDHREIEILKAENAELKATLQAIMTKLNMQQN